VARTGGHLGLCTHARGKWGEGCGNATQEAAREGGNSMLFARGRRIGEQCLLAMATERQCRDGAALFWLAEYRVWSTMEKSPNIASMLVLPTLVRCR
jgi:hypothetical protein